MSRSLRGSSRIVALIGVTGIAGCWSDGITTPGPNAPPAFAVIVSNPIALGSLPAAQLAPALATGGTDSIAFVSLAPGTIARGKELQIRNLASGFTRVDALVNGGLDPVPVPATVGDTLIVAATDSTGATQAVVFVMAAARRPVVVRTNPPPRKRDVPLNTAVIVVFSEPIDSTTLNTGLQLRLGEVQVPGRVEFRDPAHLMVTFIPAASLTAETTYQLAVTRAVTDLLGESLETPVTVEFTTEAAPAGSHLAFIVQPTSTTAGAVISPAVQVAIRDASGNTITTATDSVTLVTGDNPNGGTLSGTRTVAAVNGVASFADLSLDRASDPDPSGYALTASAAGFASATSASFRVAAGSAVALEFPQDPAKAIAGLPMWPPYWADHVKAVDVNGNQAYGFAGIVTLTIGTNPGNGTLSGATVDTAFYGVASFQELRISQPGSGYTLVASAPGLRSATTPSFDVGPPMEAAENLILFAGFGVNVVDLDNGGRATLRRSGIQPAWSPDGTRIAFSDWDGSGDQGIYVMNTDGSGVVRLTSGGLPAWSPDGSKIAFGTCFGTNCGIYVMNPDGTGITWLTPGIDQRLVPGVDPAWSPDGSKIAFVSERDGNYEIYVMNADGSGVTRITNDTALDALPAWSPDGTRIAFASTRGPLIEGFPLYDMYVMNTDGSGVTRVPSGLMSASYPSWSPDGTRIAFVATADWNLYPSQVYVMNTNGSALTPSLTVYQPRPGTYSMWYAGDPAWRPPRP